MSTKVLNNSNGFFQYYNRVYWNITGLQSNISLRTTESIIIENKTNDSTKSNLTNQSDIKSNEIMQITHTLYLNHAHGADNGYINCIAENIVGKSRDSTLIKILCK